MKKIFLSIFVIAFGLFGVFAGTPTLSVSAADDLPETVEIDDENAFYNLIKTTTEQNASKSSSEKTKLNIKLTKNLDFSENNDLIFQDFSFYGLLDGNGYSISNIQISANEGNNYGLFASASGEIKNLRLEGDAIYSFKSSGNANVGLLVGSGTELKIECCEFDVQYKTQTDLQNGGEVKEGISPSIGANFGNIVGHLENGSIVDCLNYSDVKFVAVESGNNVGGLVGSAKMVTINYAVSYGSLEYSNLNEEVGKTNQGGLVGYLSGVANIQNCAVVGAVNSPISTTRGALFGRISSLDDLRENGSKISCCYYATDIGALGENNEKVVLTDCKFVANMTTDFFENAANWSRGIPSFEFGEKYISLTDLHLQVFQSFTFRVSDMLDSALEFVKIEADGDSANENEIRVKYGKEIKIYIKYTNPNFYDPPTVGMIGAALDEGSAKVSADENVKGQYILTIFKSSFKTQGTYTFTSKPIAFDCLVESANDEQGTVKWGANTQRKLTYGQQVSQISAEGKGSYDFDHWELYTGTKVGGSVVWSERADKNFESSDFYGKKTISTTQNGQFAFGTTAPFNTHFKLVAYFSQDSAVRFSVLGDNNVSDVVIDGDSNLNTEVLMSPKATTEILVTVKKGYSLDVDRFLEDIKILYGDNSTSTVYTDDPIKDADGTTTYKIKLNFSSINIENKTLTIRFSTERSKDDSGNNLLWLWILIPCVVVLVAAVALTIFLVRRRRIYGQLAKNNTGGKAKAPKQKQEKKPDYKDYYY